MSKRWLTLLKKQYEDDPAGKFNYYRTGQVVTIVKEVERDYLENLKRLYVLQAAQCETDEERQENNKVIERIEALVTRLGMTPLKGETSNGL